MPADPTRREALRRMTEESIDMGTYDMTVPADPTYTPDPADVELVERALTEWSADWRGEPDPNREAAHVAVAALAAAGRLQPAGGETRTEWAVRWPKLDPDPRALHPEYGPDAEQHARGRVGRNRGTELYRRTVTTYPDGSTLTGPWQPAPTDPVCTCPDCDVSTWADLHLPIEERPTVKGLDPNCPIHGKGDSA